jgi:hypothetical protein
MTVITSPHSRVLAKLIADRRQVLLETLVNNIDPMLAGTIRGLDEALRLSEEADFKLNGEG